MKCRHRDSWLIAGGAYEWCYRCGALRRMRESGIASVTPMSVWQRPIGAEADNPWARFDRLSKAYVMRREATK
jgi:hypothetical protein